MAGTRTQSNFSIPKRKDTAPPEDETGRPVVSIYDELIDGYLETHAEGFKFIVVGPHLLTQEKKSTDAAKKTVETMRMMLNKRLGERKLPHDKDKSLRYEVKVRAVLVNEKLLAQYPNQRELFAGYNEGDRAVLLQERDQEEDPYTEDEVGVAKKLGKKVGDKRGPASGKAK